jgi:hypothetical protein
VAPRGAPAPRGQVPARGTANGVARYGYGYGYGYGYPYYPYYPYYGYGYPYYYGGYPYWSVGFYAGWGWPWYGGYGYWPYGDTYVMAGSEVPPQTPATIITQFTPGDAEILLDDVAVGYSKDYNGRWDELTTSPGRHTITVRKDGYRTLHVEMEAQPGARYVFDEALAEGEGEERRTVASPPPAQSDASTAAGALEGSGVTRGRLRVRAAPEDVAVYLDGEYLGLAGELSRLHGAIPLATGTHRLEFVRPGYASEVRTIDVDGANVATVDVTLTRSGDLN